MTRYVKATANITNEGIMSTESKQLYTQEQLDIEILKNNDNHLNKTLDRIESNQKWLLGVMSSGFLGLLGLIAHGFKWIV